MAFSFPSSLMRNSGPSIERDEQRTGNMLTACESYAFAMLWGRFGSLPIATKVRTVEQKTKMDKDQSHI
jgi:hypothetical protein